METEEAKHFSEQFAEAMRVFIQNLIVGEFANGDDEDRCSDAKVSESIKNTK